MAFTVFELNKFLNNFGDTFFPPNAGNDGFDILTTPKKKQKRTNHIGKTFLYLYTKRLSYLYFSVNILHVDHKPVGT